MNSIASALAFSGADLHGEVERCQWRYSPPAGPGATLIPWIRCRTCNQVQQPEPVV